MDKPSVLIQQRSFPNQNATDEEKSTIEYGLKVAKAIEGEWFKKNTNSCRFYNQWGNYHTLRLYARGEQPTQKYKNELSIDGDLSHLNLDWSPIPIIPKFVDIVVNGMSDRLFTIKAEAQDVMSAEQKNMFQDMIESDMIAKDFLNLTKSEFGVDAFNVDPNELPENDEELSLYMQLKYKPSIEIAEEMAIDTILKMNEYSETRSLIDYDMTTIGLGVVKHSFLINDGVNVEIVSGLTENDTVLVNESSTNSQWSSNGNANRGGPPPTSPMGLMGGRPGGR